MIDMKEKFTVINFLDGLSKDTSALTEKGVDEKEVNKYVEAIANIKSAYKELTASATAGSFFGKLAGGLAIARQVVTLKGEFSTYQTLRDDQTLSDDGKKEKIDKLRDLWKGFYVIETVRKKGDPPKKVERATKEDKPTKEEPAIKEDKPTKGEQEFAKLFKEYLEGLKVKEHLANFQGLDLIPGIDIKDQITKPLQSWFEAFEKVSIMDVKEVDRSPSPTKD